MADVPTVKRKSVQSIKRQERQIIVTDKFVCWLAVKQQQLLAQARIRSSTYEVKLHGVRLEHQTRKGGAEVHEATVER
jgi:hypothetical protein